MTATIKRFTNKRRTFKLSPCGHFYRVYVNGRLNGFIWNNDREVMIDGEKVIASTLFN